MLYHQNFMLEALNEAKKSLESGDVPVGAVIVKDNLIIGKGHNQVEELQNATAHAEMNAIREAIKNTGYKHLLNSIIYATLEPCSMCAGAIVLARIPVLVYAAPDLKAGACNSLYSITEDERLNHRCEVISGILEFESSQLIKEFFIGIRERNKLKTQVIG